MQVQAALAERLAMVGDIEQRGIVAILQCGQTVNRLCQQVIGVQQRVVVAVGQRLAAAAGYILGIAGWGKLPERGRIALEVCRPMVAELVQHQKQVPLWITQQCFAVGEQCLIQAALASAQRGQTLSFGADDFQIIAHTLAAGLVVVPDHPEPGLVQNMQQGLTLADRVFVVVTTTLQRKHAGHRGLGVGAAAAYMSKIDHATTTQLWRGVMTRVVGPCRLVQTPVCGTRSLAHDQHKDHRPVAASPVLALTRIGSNGHSYAVALPNVCPQNFDK